MFSRDQEMLSGIGVPPLTLGDLEAVWPDGGGPHDWGPDRTELICRVCQLHILDAGAECVRVP